MTACTARGAGRNRVKQEEAPAVLGSWKDCVPGPLEAMELTHRLRHCAYSAGCVISQQQALVVASRKAF